MIVKTKFIKPLFIILLLLEIAGFIIVGKWLGVFLTLLLILSTTVLGLAILRLQGFSMLLQIQRRMMSGEHPNMQVLDLALIMLGGFLLVVPGFITDIVGILLFIPYIRLLILRLLIKFKVLEPGPSVTPSGKIIEGEYKREDDDS